MATPVQENVQVGGKDSGTSFNLDAQLNCAGSDRLAVVEVCVPADVTASATCGGSAMTLHDSINNSAGTKVYVFRLLNPTSGNNTVTVTTDDSGSASARGRAFSGVDQTIPLRTAAKQAANTISPSVDVPSAADDFVCDALGYAYAGQSPTEGAGQTADTFAPSPSFEIRFRGSHETATSASTTMSWTMTDAGEIALIGYAVTPVSAGGVSVSPDPADTIAATVNPIVLQASQTVAPDPASAVAANAGPTVNISGTALLIDTVSIGSQNSGASFTWNHTCSSGSDRLLLLSVTVPSGINITATYAGAPMASAGSVDNGVVKLQMFQLSNPSTGSNTVSVTTNSSTAAAARSISFTGAHQTTPLGTVVTATGNSTTPSVSVGSVAGNIVIDSVAYGVAVNTYTPGTGQTADTFAANSNFDVRLRGSHETATGASTTMDWTGSSIHQWASIGVAVKIAETLVGISPAAASAVAATVNPAVGMSAMTVDLAAAPSSAVAASVDPTVAVVGGQLVIPEVASAVAAGVDPTVLGGSVVVAPAAADTVAAATGPTQIELGSITLIPSVGHAVAASTLSFFLGGYVTLAWDASVGATGYNLYYDSDSGAPYNGTGAIRDDNEQVDNSPVDVGNVLQFTLKNLASGQFWYFAVTAYNANGESAYSSELAIFVTTGLFVAPTAGNVVAAAVDPTLILGNLAVAPAAASAVAATFGPGVTTPADVAFSPEAASAVAGVTSPSVGQSSMTLNLVSAPLFTVAASVNPTVSITGGLTIAPAVANAVTSAVDPGVILGSIIIQIDNIPEIANAVAASVNPTAFEGFLVISPAAADAVAATVDPDVVLTNVIAPAAADCVAATVDPSLAFGSTEFAGDNANAVAAAVIGHVGVGSNAAADGTNGMGVRTGIMIGI